MERLQLAIPTPGVSAVALVEGIKEGEELPFAPDRVRYLRTMVSSTIKHKHPLREYSVTYNEGDPAVIVSRGKDKKVVVNQ